MIVLVLALLLIYTIAYTLIYIAGLRVNPKTWLVMTLLFIIEVTQFLTGISFWIFLKDVKSEQDGNLDAIFIVRKKISLVEFWA